MAPRLVDALQVLGSGQGHGRGMEYYKVPDKWTRVEMRTEVSNFGREIMLEGWTEMQKQKQGSQLGATVVKLDGTLTTLATTLKHGEQDGPALGAACRNVLVEICKVYKPKSRSYKVEDLLNELEQMEEQEGFTHKQCVSPYLRVVQFTGNILVHPDIENLKKCAEGNAIMLCILYLWEALKRCKQAHLSRYFSKEGSRLGQSGTQGGAKPQGGRHNTDNNSSSKSPGQNRQRKQESQPGGPSAGRGQQQQFVDLGWGRYPITSCIPDGFPTVSPEKVDTPKQLLAPVGVNVREPDFRKVVEHINACRELSMGAVVFDMGGRETVCSADTILELLIKVSNFTLRNGSVDLGTTLGARLGVIFEGIDVILDNMKFTGGATALSIRPGGSVTMRNRCMVQDADECGVQVGSIGQNATTLAAAASVATLVATDLKIWGCAGYGLRIEKSSKVQLTDCLVNKCNSRPSSGVANAVQVFGKDSSLRATRLFCKNSKHDAFEVYGGGAAVLECCVFDCNEGRELRVMGAESVAQLRYCTLSKEPETDLGGKVLEQTVVGHQPNTGQTPWFTPSEDNLKLWSLYCTTRLEADALVSTRRGMLQPSATAKPDAGATPLVNSEATDPHTENSAAEEASATAAADQDAGAAAKVTPDAGATVTVKTDVDSDVKSPATTANAAQGGSVDAEPVEGSSQYDHKVPTVQSAAAKPSLYETRTACWKYVMVIKDFVDKECEALKKQGLKLMNYGKKNEKHGAAVFYKKAKLLLIPFSCARAEELRDEIALNLAACYLECELYEECVEECKEVLAGSPANANAVCLKSKAIKKQNKTGGYKSRNMP